MATDSDRAVDWTAWAVDEYRAESRLDSVMGYEKYRRRAVAYDWLDWEYIDTLLDVGVGAGRWLRAAPQNPERHAVDINRAFLDDVADVATPVRGDVLALPYQEYSMDAVTCLGVLGHLPSPAHAKAAISELVRVVHPGGHLILSAGRRGLARWLRHCWQEARRAGKALTGVGESERRYETLGEGRVIGWLEEAGAEIEARERLTLTPGLADRVERPIGAALERVTAPDGPARGALAGTLMLRCRV